MSFLQYVREVWLRSRWFWFMLTYILAIILTMLGYELIGVAISLILTAAIFLHAIYTDYERWKRERFRSG